MNIVKPLLLIGTALLSACGGGGSGSATSSSTASTGGATPSGSVSACPAPAASTATVGSGATSLQINTLYGPIEGSRQNGARQFLGIRYASPPTGCRRFRPPQDPAYVAATTSATSRSPWCAQIYNGSPQGDEDCLFLNVWAPDDKATHPVMVWLHGGTINGLDGSRLAVETGMVVVAPNRRVGVFASLGLQQLIDESPEHTASNYDVLDTLQALRWVQRNVSAFGGDPARVLVNGASAGGTIACSLFAAPAAKGLFSSAAVMSPVCRPRQVLDASRAQSSPYAPIKDRHAALIAAAGCDGASDKLACLRGLSAQALLDAASKIAPPAPGLLPFGISMIIDGVVVTDDPYAGLAAQTAGSFPLIAGSTRDEIRSLTTLQPMDDAAYRTFLATNYGNAAASGLYGLYPPTAYPTPTDAAYMLLSDLVIGCPAQAMADAAAGNRPAYLYLFSQPPAGSTYAAHGSDFPYLFDTLDESGATPDQVALDLRAAMQSAFASLAGTPGSASTIAAGTQGTFSWPAYSAGNARIVEFGSPVKITSPYRGGRCPTLKSLVAL